MHKEVPLHKSPKAELHLGEFILAKMEESKTNSQTTSFDQLVTTFSHHNQLPKVLQPHLNRLLLLSNKRKTEAKTEISLLKQHAINVFKSTKILCPSRNTINKRIATLTWVNSLSNGCQANKTYLHFNWTQLFIPIRPLHFQIKRRNVQLNNSVQLLSHLSHASIMLKVYLAL